MFVWMFIWNLSVWIVFYEKHKKFSGRYIFLYHSYYGELGFFSMNWRRQIILLWISVWGKVFLFCRLEVGLLTQLHALSFAKECLLIQKRHKCFETYYNFTDLTATHCTHFIVLWKTISLISYFDLWGWQDWIHLTEIN